MKTRLSAQTIPIPTRRRSMDIPFGSIFQSSRSLIMALPACRGQPVTLVSSFGTVSLRYSPSTVRPAVGALSRSVVAPTDPSVFARANRREVRWMDRTRLVKDRA